MKKNLSFRRIIRGVVIACFITVALSPLVSLASAQSLIDNAPTGDQTAVHSENTQDSSAASDSKTDNSEVSDKAPSSFDSDDEAGAYGGDQTSQTEQSEQGGGVYDEAAQTQDPSNTASSQALPPSSQPDSPVEDGGSTYYVSATGNDDSDGTENDPLASIAAAVNKQTEATPTTIVVLSDLTVQTTANVGAKNIIVMSKSGIATLSAAAGSSVNFFEMDTGNLTLKNIAVDGKSYLFDHHVVSLNNGVTSTDTVGSLILDNTHVKNWFSSAKSGAFSIVAPSGSMVMKNASSIDNCQIQGEVAYAGGAAVRVTAGRGETLGQTPTYDYRAKFRLEDSSSITNCACNLTKALDFSGGAAVYAFEAQVSMDKDTRITGCNVTYKDASGLIEMTYTAEGTGALFAWNAKLDMGGTVSDCHVYSKASTRTDGYAVNTGGGGVSIYVASDNYANKVDCRTVISGTVKDCSAPSGGGVRYWSDNNQWGEGDLIWKTPDQAKSSKEAMERVYDSIELTGTISNCWTEDVTRSITLDDPAQYHYIGTGGGGICLANHGMLVVEDTALIENCRTRTKGGAISNLQTSILFRAESEGSQGALIKGCSSDGIAGGVAGYSFTNIENLRIDDCHAGQEGGALYVRDYDLVVYDCLITNCTAGTYGGAIMQDITHMIFWYGGTLKNNHAGIGGGGIAVNTWLGQGSEVLPYGIAFNYPVNLNGGYVNSSACQATILVDKIKAPTVILGNTQGEDNKKSDIWTSDNTHVKGLSKYRLFVYNDFVQGSRVGAIINEGVKQDNAPGVQFGYVYGDDANLRVFGDNVDTSLIGSHDSTIHTDMVWAKVDNYTVSYDGNPLPGTSITGSVPFDGHGTTQNVYDFTEEATVLEPGDMKDEDFAFLGWSTDPHAKEPSYQPGDFLSYSPDIDLGGGNIVLYAVWSDRPFICQIIRQQDGKDTLFKKYATLYEAFRDTQANDRVEMFKDAPLVNFEDSANQFPEDGCLSEKTPNDLLLTTAPKNQPVDRASAWMGEDRGDTPIAILTRTQKGSLVSWMRVSAGNLTTENITFDGGCTVSQVKAGQPGLQGKNPLIEVTTESTTLTLNDHTSIHSAYNENGIGGGVGVIDGADFYMKAGAEITDCSAEKGGGLQAVSHTATTSDANISAGKIHDNYALSYGGGAYIDQSGSISLDDDAQVSNNAAGTSGGGIYGENGSEIAIGNARVTNNKATGEMPGEPHEEMVGGIGYRNQVHWNGSVHLSDNPVISDNLGHRAGQSALEPAVASDLQAEISDGNQALVLVYKELGDQAHIGIISDQPETLESGNQFASTVSEAKEYSHLDRFFNDVNASLISTAGDGKTVVWQPSSVRLTKVGANETTGLYEGLPGASFNVYSYHGEADLNATTINDGTIDLASVKSLQWAPLIDEKGTEGVPGYSNIPYSFESVDGDDTTKGTTTLTGLKTNVWYMLVESGAPQDFSKPGGQWAFKITDGSAGEASTPDLNTMLAHKGSDGSLPPAFTRQVITADGQKTGVFLINIPIFDLPFTGIGQMLLWILAAVGLVTAAVGLRLRSKRHGETR